jgi:hypothetical protein
MPNNALQRTSCAGRCARAFGVYGGGNVPTATALFRI